MRSLGGDLNLERCVRPEKKVRGDLRLPHREMGAREKGGIIRYLRRGHKLAKGPSLQRQWCTWGNEVDCNCKALYLGSLKEKGAALKMRVLACMA